MLLVSSLVDMAQEGISELEDMSIKNSKKGKQKEQIFKKQQNI